MPTSALAEDPSGLPRLRAELLRKPLATAVFVIHPELILSWQRRLLAKGRPRGRRTRLLVVLASHPLRMSMRTLDLIKFSWACNRSLVTKPHPHRSGGRPAVALSSQIRVIRCNLSSAC